MRLLTAALLFQIAAMGCSIGCGTETRLVATVVPIVTLSAQTPSGEPHFDVISIKSVSSMPTGAGPQAPDLFSLPFGTAHQLVSIAYGLPAYRVIGSGATSRDVIDKTGLTGAFDLDLTYAEDSGSFRLSWSSLG